MTSRNEFVAELQRLRESYNKTRSRFLKRDYGKAIKRMERDLREYDSYRKERARECISG